MSNCAFYKSAVSQGGWGWQKPDHAGPCRFGKEFGFSAKSHKPLDDFKQSNMSRTMFWKII